MTRFVVLFPGRSGSTYVMSALDAHPKISATGEVLDPLRPQGAAAQLDRPRRVPTDDLREVITNLDEVLVP